MKAMWVLLVVFLFTLTLISPTLLHASCINEPDSITLIDERMAETPVTWVCDMEQWWVEYEEYCDLDGSRPELPQCLMVELSEILERLTDATGEDSYFLHHSCERFVDCRLVRDLVPLDWDKEWSPCGLKNTEEVLELAEIEEYLELGDLAATRNSCGEPSWHRSVVVDSGSPPQVKVLASHSGNWTEVGGRMVSWQKVGDPCCDSTEGWGREVREDEVHSSAIRFQVDGDNEWIAGVHSAHLFATSGLALFYRYSVFGNADFILTDHEDSVRYDVFAWPPAGFQEVSVGDEWCQTWCAEEDTGDSTEDTPAGGSDMGGAESAEPLEHDEPASAGKGCGIADGSSQDNHAGMLCLVFVLASLFGPMLRRAPRTLRGRSQC